MYSLELAETSKMSFISKKVRDSWQRSCMALQISQIPPWLSVPSRGLLQASSRAGLKRVATYHQSKQLPVYQESIIKQPTYTESEAKKVEMAQEIAEIQEQKRSHSFDSNNQHDLMREIEEQLKINIMKANNLHIKFHSQNEENHYLVIWNPECWGMVREFESVIMVVDCLIRAL